MAVIDLVGSIQCQTDLAGDPLAGSVLLSVQGAGAGGSTTVVDSSANPVTLSVFGNTKVDTSNAKFLGGSLLLDGAGDYITSTNARFAFGTNSTTIEFFFNAASLSQAYHIIFDTRPVGGNGGILIWVNASGQVRAYADGNGVNSDASRDVYTATGAVVANTWYHCTLTCTSSQMVLYLNAATSGNMSVSRTSTALTGTTLNIGRTREDGNYFNGRIERLRITNALRTAAVPTAPYPDRKLSPTLSTAINLNGSANTVLTASAGLTTAIRFVGSVAGTAIVTSSLTTNIALGGAASGSTAVSGVLAAGASLAGLSAVTASLTGALTASIRLGGATGTALFATGVLTTSIRLGGSVSATTFATAALAVGSALVATAQCVVVTAGALTVPVAAPLTGDVYCATAVVGALLTPTFSGGPYMLVPPEDAAMLVPAGSTQMSAR